MIQDGPLQTSITARSERVLLRETFTKLERLLGAEAAALCGTCCGFILCPRASSRAGLLPSHTKWRQLGERKQNIIKGKIFQEEVFPIQVEKELLTVCCFGRSQNVALSFDEKKSGLWEECFQHGFPRATLPRAFQ